MTQMTQMTKMANGRWVDGWIDMLNPEDRRKGEETKPTDSQRDGQARYFSFLFLLFFWREIQEAGVHGKRDKRQMQSRQSVKYSLWSTPSTI